MFLIFTLFVIFGFSGEVHADNVYFRNLRCNFSDEFVHKNISCYAKSYSWKVSTINYMVVFKKPFDNILVSLKKIRSSSNVNFSEQIYFSDFRKTILSIWKYLSGCFENENVRLVPVDGWHCGKYLLHVLDSGVQSWGNGTSCS